MRSASRAPILEGTRLQQALAASEARLRSTLSDLETVRRQAREANAARDRSLAIMVHELRAPLTPMLIMAQSLENDPALSPRQHEQIATLRRSVELEARLVGDLLDLMRIAHGKLELALAETAIDGKLHEVLAGCDRQIRDKRLAVVLRLRAANHRVRADPVRLYQILWNLIHNAVKFTPDDGRITVQSKNVQAGLLVLEVADTGIGIAPDVLPCIFDPFEQGPREVTRKFGGLGVGLAVCKSLVEAHGGTLSARSEGRGQGAVFTVQLPLARR